MDTVTMSLNNTTALPPLPLVRRGYIPVNLAAFLDHAASLILLRKVSGGYIFIQHYLLEYFADLEPENAEQQT